MPLIITLGLIVIAIMFITFKLNKKENTHVEPVEVKTPTNITEIEVKEQEPTLPTSDKIHVETKEENIMLEEENKITKTQKKKPRRHKNK